MPKKDCHSRDKSCKKCSGKCRKCIEIIVQVPTPTPVQPFIGMSVYKSGNQLIDPSPIIPPAPVLITNWSDDRINGRKFFYIEPDTSFNTTTGAYTVTRAGKYRSSANLQIENENPGAFPTLSVTFAIILNNQVIQQFFGSASVQRDTISITIALQLNAGDVLQLGAYGNIIGASYTIIGTIDPSAENPVRTNWAVTRFAD